MKIIFHCLIFSTSLFTQAIAVGNNALENACGYEVLTSEQINGLYSWKAANHVVIGAEPDQHAQDTAFCSHSGYYFDDKSAACSHLAGIAFEIEECSTSVNLVAERESLGRARYKGMHCVDSEVAEIGPK